MSNEKTVELLRKLKALADRGVGGEKTNAETMLANLLDKHGMTIADIEGEQKQWFRFKYLRSHSRLWFQISASVIGNYKYTKISNVEIELECTEAERIEMEAKYDFYVRAFNKEYETFVMAFIMKNELWPKPGGTHSGRSAEEMTPEELKQYKAAMKLAENLKKSHFLKQIDHG